VTDAEAARLAAEAAVSAAWVGVVGSVVVAVVALLSSVVNGVVLWRREAARSRLEELRERKSRSDEAARAALGEIEKAADRLGEWVREHKDVRGEGLTQDELEPTFHAIRAQAIEISDPEVRSLVDSIAGVLYLQDLARTEFVDWQIGQLAFKIRTAGREVLGAYLRGEQIPPQPELTKLDKDLDDFLEELTAPDRGG
jgi:hypothetical protein